MSKLCPKTDFQINWYLVSECYNWAARDTNGRWYVYITQPGLSERGGWGCQGILRGWAPLSRYQWIPTGQGPRQLSRDEALKSLRKRTVAARNSL